MDIEGEGEIGAEQREAATAEPEEAALSALSESPAPGQADPLVRLVNTVMGML